MFIILVSVGVMMAFAVLMSLGLLITGKELKGTCASRNVALYGEGAVCGMCGKVPDGNCENKTENIGNFPEIKR